MLQVENLSKSFGSQTLFRDLSFHINTGEKIAIIGRNGQGKTTLFRILIDKDFPDGGTFSFSKNYSVGILEQHIHFTEKTVLKETCLSLPRLEKNDHWRVEKILSGLGFSNQDFDKDPTLFSGGFQLRINLAKTLLSKPNLLLLDEPTNYLDILSIRWVKKMLQQWRGEILCISHDRNFMDSFCTHSLGFHLHTARKIKGKTTDFFRQVQTEEQVYEQTRINEEKKQAQSEKFINQFRAKARMAGMVQSRIKSLNKKEILHKKVAVKNLDFRFTYFKIEAKNLLHLHNTHFNYKPEEPIIQNLTLDINNGSRIAIIGPNGKGKSTLLRIIGKKIKPLEGKIKTHINTLIGHFEQSNINSLDSQRSIEEEIALSGNNLDRTKIRQICGAMLFEGTKAQKKIEVLSGGEKARVCLGKILATPCNLLLLDEPSHHLDSESVECLLTAIKHFPGAIVLVTHDEDVIHQFADQLIVFEKNKHFVFNGTYSSFLSEKGWSNEENLENTNTKTDKPSTFLINKNQKIQQRKIQQSLNKLEQRIGKLESIITNQEETLVSHYENNLFKEAEILIKEITQNKKDIDSTFSEIELLDLEN